MYYCAACFDVHSDREGARRRGQRAYGPAASGQRKFLPLRNRITLRFLKSSSTYFNPGSMLSTGYTHGRRRAGGGQHATSSRQAASDARHTHLPLPTSPATDEYRI
ncbi:uncharacterized protein LOC134648704 [Cydia amplana]|uniref:uncharacterized protein LOC134648704 n=1 Tax=Cydia amplana TaxID=1869771 RepID=UPI002FE57147